MSYTSREVYEFVSCQINDPIVERKTCRVSGTDFPIYQSDLDFYVKISPTFDGKKFQIPTPTLCPEERQRRRLSFRNERKLYKRTCDATGENIISIYSPDKPYKVYDQKFRRSDNRNPLDYGREFDFSKTFTEQFGELMLQVPLMSTMVIDNENSPYTNSTGWSKNVYMCGDVMHSDTVLYANTLKNCIQCVDVTDCKECVGCYELVRSIGCYQCFYGSALENCRDSFYLSDAANCDSCFFSFGLRNKKNYLYNKQVDEKTIFRVKKDIANGNIAGYIQHMGTMLYDRIYASVVNSGSENCYGNLLLDSKDTQFYYESYTIESCRYGLVADHNDHCLDVSICNPHCSYSYELIGGGEQVNCMMNSIVSAGRNVSYSFLCINSSHLFGSIGLRNKQYCIFNKQYTKEEYEKQVAKIVAHMQTTGERGEFFDPSLSPFGYNETGAQEYYPTEMSNEKIKMKNGSKEIDLSEYGYKRSHFNADPVIPTGAQVMQGDAIPTDITIVTDDILKVIFVCELSGRPFRIIKQELDFYRTHTLPLPRKHPDVRHEERMKLRPGRTLHLRTCTCCGKEMLSVYSAEYTGKICCEDCYKQEVYG